MSAGFDDADRARCVAFLDGTLEADERERFLRRLADEPALAAELESIAAVDDALRARPRLRGLPRTTSPNPTRSLRLVAALAAAAIVVALFAIAPWSTRVAAPRVALVASDESPLDWLERHGELGTLRPPGLDELRGADERTNVDAREFVERVLATARTAASATEVESGFYRVELAAEAPLSALVVAFAAAGAPARVFPEVRDASAAARAARIEAGRRVLPREPFALVERSSVLEVEYDRGFLVPIGARELRVLVATRSDPLDERDVAAVDEALARRDSETALQGALRARGFDVRVLVVREPR